MEATAERKQQTRTISNYPPDISESLAASDSCNCCLSNYNYLQHSIPCRICILVSSIWHGKVGSRIAVALCYALDPQHLYLGCNVFSHDHVAAPYKYIWCSTIGLSRGFHSKVHLFINPNKFRGSKFACNILQRKAVFIYQMCKYRQKSISYKFDSYILYVWYYR